MEAARSLVNVQSTVSTNTYVGINQSSSLTLYRLLFIQNISLFLIDSNPRLILHNQLAALIEFGRRLPYSENDVTCTG